MQDNHSPVKPAEHEQAAIDSGEVRRALAEKRRDGSWASAHTDRILVDAAEAWLREHEQAAQDAVIDCGDNSCLFAPSDAGGLRTNGGCMCFERAGFGAHPLSAARKMLPEVLRLRKEIAAARAEEREACAQECERIASGKAWSNAFTARTCASNIRWRSAQDEHGGKGE